MASSVFATTVDCELIDRAGGSLSGEDGDVSRVAGCVAMSNTGRCLLEYEFNRTNARVQVIGVVEFG